MIWLILQRLSLTTVWRINKRHLYFGDGGIVMSLAELAGGLIPFIHHGGSRLICVGIRFNVLLSKKERTLDYVCN
mgnify:CR=1 FL=1